MQSLDLSKTPLQDPLLHSILCRTATVHASHSSACNLQADSGPYWALCPHAAGEAEEPYEPQRDATSAHSSRSPGGIICRALLLAMDNH